MSGWIKLHRSILEWEWYSDKNTKSVFIHLLLTANIENKRWHGIEILRGQTFTSIQSLSKELKLTSKQTRNCLTKLKSSGEIGIQGANNGTMITVCNYESYQDFEKQEGKQTGKPRANKGQLLKNTRIEELIVSEQILKLNSWIEKNAPNVLNVQYQITDEQLTELKKKYTGDKIRDYLLRMHNWKDTAKKNTSVYLTMLSWIRQDLKKERDSRI